ncbi:MAG: type III-B CRISPR-associated protein Cas10/Cmr2 [Opitutales bacterium]|nr:type III-B CRISPR-associated protein Cas10/Cmr2 [Opitutales bacterium]
MEKTNDAFWKRKLLAFLHDTPSKCLDIASHTDKSRSAMLNAGFVDTEVTAYNRASDHMAAAADRFPFPNSKNHITPCRFDGINNGFHHPLGGGKETELKFEIPKDGSMEADGIFQPLSFDNSDGALSFEEKFWVHWRFWKKNAVEKDWRFNFFPADTRIPDHSIWTHMQIVSALSNGLAWKHRDEAGISGTYKDSKHLGVSFLKFQLGPVQDFIAAARSTRDLWSGSYLLSWLMAKGLAKLSELIGPDSVIFPNLWGQPLIDLHLKESLWDQLLMRAHDNGEQKSAWEALGHKKEDFHIPNLPNVFLAVVPTEIEEELAEAVEQCIRVEWAAIAQKCKDKFLKDCYRASFEQADKKSACRYEVMEERFQNQVERHLQISWQAFPLPTDLDTAIALHKAIVPTEKATNEKESAKQTGERIQAIQTLCEEYILEGDRDTRCFEDGKLKNVGLVWAMLYEINATLLDGVRQLREFDAWETEDTGIPGKLYHKDALTGKEEMLLGGPDLKQENLPNEIKNRFKHNDYVGAITFIKRVWDKAYLQERYGDVFEKITIRDIPSIATESDKDDEQEQQEQGYFAVIAFDGDSIGKWVSGELAPKIGTQLASYTDSENKKKGLEAYLEAKLSDDKIKALDVLNKTPRPVSPSYHLQLSEALSNFALKCAQPIVAQHKGQLIYAGGDDVLALLPARRAIACAQDLARAFRGIEPNAETQILAYSQDGIPTHGYLKTKKGDGQDYESVFILPGLRATASAGIVIAHSKSPLQDAVRAAQKAEKTAKKVYGRNAIAVRVMKRSGEITEWGAKLFEEEKRSNDDPQISIEEGHGLALLNKLLEGLGTTRAMFSAKFPHRLEEVLTPLLDIGESQQSDDLGFDLETYLERELENNLFAKQKGEKANDTKAYGDFCEGIKRGFSKYLKEIEAIENNKKSKDHKANHLLQTQLSKLIGLCRTAAWISSKDTNGHE